MIELNYYGRLCPSYPGHPCHEGTPGVELVVLVLVKSQRRRTCNATAATC